MNADGTNAAVAMAQENWRPPTELARSTPRPVSLTLQGIVASGLAVLLIAGGVLLAGWLSVQVGREKALAQRMAAEGVVTSGLVTEIGPAQGDDNEHKIRYRYQLNGQTYHTSATVGSSAAEGLEAGSGVQIRYLPTDPAQSWIVGHEPKATPVWTPPLVAVAMLFASGVIFFRIKRQRFLLADGRPALGRVTKVRWAGSNHGGGHYRASYEFTGPDGQMYTGCFRGSKKKCGAAGTPVTVLYVPDNPRRNGRYPMQFVKIAEW
jgi:hypothetical protein